MRHVERPLAPSRATRPASMKITTKGGVLSALMEDRSAPILRESSHHRPVPNTVSSKMLAQAMIFTCGRGYSGRNKELFNALHPSSAERRFLVSVSSAACSTAHGVVRKEAGRNSSSFRDLGWARQRRRMIRPLFIGSIASSGLFPSTNPWGSCSSIRHAV